VLCGAVGKRLIVISSVGATAATFAHLQYDASHLTKKLFLFCGCKVAVGVGDVNVMNICACTPIGSAATAMAAPGDVATSLA
jgi:hypothetical protein